MYDPGRPKEPTLSIRRIRTVRLDSRSAARAVVAGDLHVEDAGVRGRQIGDGAPSNLERLAESSAALGAVLEGEGQRWSVGDRPRSGAAEVAGLSAARTGVRASLSRAVDDTTRGDAPRLGGALRGGEDGCTGLAATKLLLGPAILGAELP